MRVKRGLVFLLAMTLLFGVLSIGAGEVPEGETETDAEPNARIYYINVSTSWLSGDCILIESDGHYGLIDAGHRRQSSITDEDGTVYYCSAGAGLSCDYNGKNGETIANILLFLHQHHWTASVSKCQHRTHIHVLSQKNNSQPTSTIP